MGDAIKSIVSNVVANIDSWTLGVAFLIVLIKIVLRWFKSHVPCISRNTCTTDLLNGAVIMPFVTMVGGVFSSVLAEAVHNGSLLNGLAGAVGLFFIAGEILTLPAKSTTMIGPPSPPLSSNYRSPNEPRSVVSKHTGWIRDR